MVQDFVSTWEPWVQILGVLFISKLDKNFFLKKHSLQLHTSCQRHFFSLFFLSVDFSPNTLRWDLKPRLYCSLVHNQHVQPLHHHGSHVKCGILGWFVVCNDGNLKSATVVFELWSPRYKHNTLYPELLIKTVWVLWISFGWSALFYKKFKTNSGLWVQNTSLYLLRLWDCKIIVCFWRKTHREINVVKK